MPRITFAAAATGLILSAGLALADDDKLSVGHKAPALEVSEWVKGKPVSGFESGKVYVVEFWATWCGPCIAQMPHLTQLQKEYKDKGVTIIGVSSEDPNNSLEKVQKMVEAKGDEGMGYAVAFDAGRVANKAFMQAAEQRGIPCSFVVDPTGDLAYIGHPIWLDVPLAELVDGTWSDERATTYATHTAKAFGVLYGRDVELEDKLDFIGEFEAQFPKVASMPMMAEMKFGMYLEAGHYDKAWEAGRVAAKTAAQHKDAMLLNQISWTIVDPESTWEQRDLDLAMMAGTKAAELTEWQDAAILDTVARVYFRQGKLDKAVELQAKAVEFADDRMKADLQKALDEYQAAVGGAG